MRRRESTIERNWFQVLLAAASAFYFGWVYGQTHTGVQEIIIEGQKIQVPKEIYDQVKGMLESITK